MSYNDTISALAEDAEQLEQVYQTALQAGETDAFQEAIDRSHTTAPDNLLYAAWFTSQTDRRAGKGIRRRRVGLSPGGHNGLLFWWFSDDCYTITIKGTLQSKQIGFYARTVVYRRPFPRGIWTHLSGTAVVVGKRRMSALAGISLIAAAVYVLLIYPQLGIRPFSRNNTSACWSSFTLSGMVWCRRDLGRQAP